MIAILTSILAFLIETWAFWILSPVLLFVTYSALTSRRRGAFPVSPILAYAVLLAAIGYKYPALRHYALTWTGGGILVGGYVVAGFVVSLLKWVVSLLEFMRSGSELLLGS